jgi:hypothetical protein
VVVGLFNEEGDVTGLDLSKLKPGQLILARNAFQQSLARIVAESDSPA